MTISLKRCARILALLLTILPATILAQEKVPIASRESSSVPSATPKVDESQNLKLAPLIFCGELNDYFSSRPKSPLETSSGSNVVVGKTAESPAIAPEKNYRFLQSNGLLIEEAYHQEPGEVQHTFSTLRGRDGLGTSAFSQEWPLWSEKHQLSVTMPIQLAANVLDGLGRGIGDVEIGYSYFLLGNNDTRVTIRQASA